MCYLLSGIGIRSHVSRLGVEWGWIIYIFHAFQIPMLKYMHWYLREMSLRKFEKGAKNNVYSHSISNGSEFRWGNVTPWFYIYSILPPGVYFMESCLARELINIQENNLATWWFAFRVVDLFPDFQNVTSHFIHKDFNAIDTLINHSSGVSHAPAPNLVEWLSCVRRTDIIASNVLRGADFYASI